MFVIRLLIVLMSSECATWRGAELPPRCCADGPRRRCTAPPPHHGAEPTLRPCAEPTPRRSAEPPSVLVRLLPWLFWGRLAAPKRGPLGGPFFGQGAIDASETPPAHTATNPLKLTTPSLGEHNGTAGAVRLFTRCVHDSRTWSMKHPRNLL